MAEDLRNNSLPRILSGITTRATIELILAPRYRRPGLHTSMVRDALKYTKRKPEVKAARSHIKRLQTEDYWLNLPSIKNIESMITLLKVASKTPGNQYLTRGIPDLNAEKKLIEGGIKDAERWQLAHDTMLGYCRNIPDRKQERELRDLEYSLIGAKIPGFFPTPASIVKQMLQVACISQEMKVLEPSAGKGDIAEGIQSNYPDVDLTVIEWNYTLSKILGFKGFDCLQEDFLEHKGKYDRIVMNPPFENFLLAVSSKHYPVTPGDVYRLTFLLANDTVSNEILVESDYRLNLNIFGELNAENMSFSELKPLVEKRIADIKKGT